MTKTDGVSGVQELQWRVMVTVSPSGLSDLGLSLEPMGTLCFKTWLGLLWDDVEESGRPTLGAVGVLDGAPRQTEARGGAQRHPP